MAELGIESHHKYTANMEKFERKAGPESVFRPESLMHSSKAKPFVQLCMSVHVLMGRQSCNLDGKLQSERVAALEL